MQERQIHRIFEASVLIKAAHSLMECLGGLALAIASNQSIVALIDHLTQDKLIGNPRDVVATLLLDFTKSFSIETQHFYAFYLLSHGIVKLGLIIALLKKKLWAYPALLGVLALFIVYQLYRYSFTHSVGLIALTVFDIFVMWLVWHEYSLLRRRLPVT